MVGAYPGIHTARYRRNVGPKYCLGLRLERGRQTCPRPKGRKPCLKNGGMQRESGSVSRDFRFVKGTRVRDAAALAVTTICLVLARFHLHKSEVSGIENDSRFLRVITSKS